MALGNANTSAQARGKNKAVKIRKRTEVRNASSYISFSSSTVQSNGSNACAATMDQTYYHDGSSSYPIVNDKVYKRARANDRYFLADGHYKYDRSGANYAMEITSGVVVSVTRCR